MVRKLSPARKEDLFRAALALFAAQGIPHTTTADIARRAGVAAGTLFLYFPTRQALVDELVLKIGREQSEYIKTRLDPALPARQAFWTIWQGSVQWFLDHPEAYQYVRQTREAGVVSDAAVAESYQYVDYYFTAIQHGLSEGSIQSYPPEVTGGFLYQDIVAVMDLVRAQPDPERQSELIALGFDIFWNGIKK